MNPHHDKIGRFARPPRRPRPSRNSDKPRPRIERSHAIVARIIRPQSASPR